MRRQSGEPRAYPAIDEGKTKATMQASPTVMQFSTGTAVRSKKCRYRWTAIQRSCSPGTGVVG